VLIGVVGQFIIMPLIAFALAKLLNLPAEIAAGVMLVGCCPGGTSSNVMSFLGKGDVPLSVTITACTTLLAPVVTPSLFYIFANQWLEIDPVAMFFSIVKIVLLPIVGGVIVNALFRNAVTKVVVAMPLVSVSAIIAIVAAVVAVSCERIATTGLMIFLVVVLHNTTGYLLGFILGKVFGMKLKQKKTLAIEIGMQNSGLSVALANGMALKGMIDPVAAVPGAIFSVWHNISGPIVATIFANMKDDETSEQK
ncbi:MAG: bile acid:sodium symporter family protein, partial [Succinivibrio sp.]